MIENIEQNPSRIKVRPEMSLLSYLLYKPIL